MRGERQSTETLSFLCWREWCSFTRGAAFTLAEVLITLGIIGVVAAMSLPALVQNNRAKELESALKVAQTSIEEGLRFMQAENGFPPTAKDYPVSGSFYPEYKKHFKKIIDCGFSTPNEDICMSRNSTHGVEGGYLHDLTYKTYNGKTNLYSAIFDDGQFVLPNGMLILIENTNNSHNLFISADINGKKKGPNRLGQDLFIFQVMSDGKLLPMGAPNTAYAPKAATEDTPAADYCSVSSTSNINGAGCTYKALTDKNFFKNMPK